MSRHKPLDTDRLIVGLVDILAGGNALAMNFERLARDLGISDGAQTVIFLSGVKKILRELPDKAFVDRNARLGMVDAVQDALDQAIDMEEAMADERHEGNR